MDNENAEFIKMMDRHSTIDAEIINRIQNFLKVKDCPYLYDKKYPNSLNFEREYDHRKFMMNIFLQNGEINLKCDPHLSVQTNTYSLMCVYANEFNNNIGTFGFMVVDPVSGSLSLNYSYRLNDPDDFDADSFWSYATMLFSSSLNTYTKAAHLAVGMLDSADEKEMYKKLSEMTLKTIDEKFGIANVSYDAESLKRPPSPYSDLLKDLYNDFPAKGPYKRAADPFSKFAEGERNSYSGLFSMNAKDNGNSDDSAGGNNND